MKKHVNRIKITLPLRGVWAKSQPTKKLLINLKIKKFLKIREKDDFLLQNKCDKKK
jgi:hypothetical protein